MSSNNNQPSENKHFKEYVRVLWNRWPLILVILFAFLASSYFYVQTRQKLYASSAKIQVDEKNKDIEVFRPGYDSFNTTFFQTQRERIQSKQNLYPVIEQLDLIKWYAKVLDRPANSLNAEQVYNYMLKAIIDVNPVRNTKLIEIEAKSIDPDQAARLANAIAQNYQQARLSDIQSRESSGIQVLREQVVKQEKLVEDAKVKVEELRVKYRINEVSAGASASANTSQEEELRRKEASLSELQNDLASRQVRMDQVKKLTTEQLENVLPTIGMEDSTITSTKQRYYQSMASLQSLLKQGIDEQHPKAVSAKAEVREIRKQLDSLIEGVRTGMEIDLKVARTRVENMDKEVSTMREDVRLRRTGQIAPYLDAQKTLDEERNQLEVLKAHLKQQEIESKIGDRPVEIINEAEPNIKPVSPRTVVFPWLYLDVLLAGFGGVVFGVFLAFFIEYLDTSVKTMDDAEKFLGINVLAVIPQGVTSLNLEGPNSPNAEGYRILRTKLNLGMGGPQVITFVSGGPSEGKSTTAFNTAYVTAQGGVPTLLIDADFRRPNLHQILGIQNEFGTADFAVGRREFQDCLQQGPVEQMHVMTAGVLQSSEMSLFTMQKLNELLSVARQHYGLIILDSPPILGVSDASLIVKNVEATILVIQHRRYPRHVAARAKRAVTEMGGNLVGAVLNKVYLNSDESYYYYTSYYNHYGYDGKARREVKRNVRRNKKLIANGDYIVEPSQRTSDPNNREDTY